jgi:superfamily II DNA or RNA helicase
MGIAHQLTNEFDEGVRSRGHSYFIDDRVYITATAQGDSITSKVRGTVTYRVKMRLRDTALLTSCSCPFFGEHGSPCKHIWATILAVDAQGLLSSAFGRPVRYVPDVRGRDGIDKPGLPKQSRRPGDPVARFGPHEPMHAPFEPGGQQVPPMGAHSVPPPPVPPHRPDSMKFPEMRRYSDPSKNLKHGAQQHGKRYVAVPGTPNARRSDAYRAQPPDPARRPRGAGLADPYGPYGYPPPGAHDPARSPGAFTDPGYIAEPIPPRPDMVRELTAPWESRDVFVERIVPRAEALNPSDDFIADYDASHTHWALPKAGGSVASGYGRSVSPRDQYAPGRPHRHPDSGHRHGPARPVGGQQHLIGYGPGPGARLQHPSAMRYPGKAGHAVPGYPPEYYRQQGLANRRPDQTAKARAAANAALARATEVKRPSLFFIVDVAPILTGGQVVVDLGRRKRRTDMPSTERGIIQTWKPSQAAYVDFLKTAAPEDLELLDVLVAATEPTAPADDKADPRAQKAALAKKRFPMRGPVQYRFQLQPEATAGVIERLVRLGRCRIRRSENPSEEPPLLRWDDGPPWKFGLDIKSDASNKRWTWRGALRRNDQKLDLAEPVAILPGLVFSGIGRIARFDDSSLPKLVKDLRDEKEIQLSDIEQDEKLARILEESKLSVDQLTDSTIWSELEERPTPCIILRTPRQSWGPERIVADMYFDYGNTRIPLSQAGAMTVESQKLRIIHRDQDAEADATRLLWELGFRPNSDIIADSGSLELPPKKLNQVTKDLVAFGWYVEVEGKRFRPASEFKLAVSTHLDWFELGGNVSFGGQMVPLPDLLKAAQKGETSITLPDGSIGVLPEDWLRKYGFLTGLGKSDGDVLKFTKNQAALLDSMLASQPDITFDDGFSAARAQLQSFQGISAIEPPPMFRGELRPYQKEGLGWLNYLQEFGFGGILADDMGLGKTVQVLAQMMRWRESKQRKGPSLIVVPRSLVFNWIKEAGRFTPNLRILDYTGPNRQTTLSQFDKYDLIFTTYGTLRSDIVELAKLEFDYVILDEAQAIKNADSQAAKAARILRGKNRLAMSGTPIENHLGELWSLFEFINPGMLGSAALFKRIASAATGADPAARESLARSLRPFILRRTKKQVVQDLPEKTEQFLHCELEPAQRAYYDQLRDHYRQALLRNEAAAISGGKLAGSKIEVLEALLRLRQAACHPGLIDSEKRENSSAKLDVLLPHLEEVIDEGHKVLIFSQFTSFLSIVKERLDTAKIKYEYLDGRTRDRQARVDSFQNDPSIPVFLISLKAGGLGLNLTSAEYVYLLDPWWNPAVEAQAIDRSHRIGQTQHVFAYRLIATDTVEQKIVELQAHKRELADAILGGDSRMIQSLTREDLEYLLS